MSFNVRYSLHFVQLTRVFFHIAFPSNPHPRKNNHHLPLTTPITNSTYTQQRASTRVEKIAPNTNAPILSPDAPLIASFDSRPHPGLLPVLIADNLLATTIGRKLPSLTARWTIFAWDEAPALKILILCRGCSLPYDPRGIMYVCMRGMRLL